jgi:transcriptional regulator with XRE-family HTH domain
MLNTKAPQPLDAQIGARMRLRRISMKMNQESLADALGVTFQQVQKYENGKNRVSASRLQAVADVLDVPITYFFDGSGSSKAGGGNASTHDDVVKLLQTRDAIRMARAYSAITDARLRVGVLHLAESIAAREVGDYRDPPGKATRSKKLAAKRQSNQERKVRSQRSGLPSAVSR